MAQVILPMEDFAADLDNLGRANGNIYYRVPGAEGFHDGQVMVRLKKQRFVILDYSIQPNEADLQAAEENENIKIPSNAGKAICTKANVRRLRFISCCVQCPSKSLAVFVLTTHARPFVRAPNNNSAAK
jgi:hypothetical protein